MKEEILTAKEWLEKEGIYNSHDLGLADQIENGKNPKRFNLDTVMERYANYKTKMLEAKILEFREKLKKDTEGKFVEEVLRISAIQDLQEFDEHFGIEVKKEGKI